MIARRLVVGGVVVYDTPLPASRVSLSEEIGTDPSNINNAETNTITRSRDLKSSEYIEQMVAKGDK